MNSVHVHTTHPQVLNRLKRADGHLHNVITMIGERKPCLDIVQQLRAVKRAISAAKKAFVHDHLDHGLEEAMRVQPRGRRAAIGEFKDITKYL